MQAASTLGGSAQGRELPQVGFPNLATKGQPHAPAFALARNQAGVLQFLEMVRHRGGTNALVSTQARAGQRSLLCNLLKNGKTPRVRESTADRGHLVTVQLMLIGFRSRVHGSKQVTFGRNEASLTTLDDTESGLGTGPAPSERTHSQLRTGPRTALLCSPLAIKCRHRTTSLTSGLLTIPHREAEHHRCHLPVVCPKQSRSATPQAHGNKWYVAL